jgi:hypothetical protein
VTVIVRRYRICCWRRRTEILRRMAVLISPVLVGRRAELETLVSSFERARAGEPAFVVVGGEAGVGKTRLVEEVATRAADAGARVLTGASVELGGEGLPFAPLVDALRALARSTEPDELDAYSARPAPSWLGCCPSSIPRRA